MRCDGEQDLHSHGNTGHLGQGESHRSGWGPQSAQVGDGVNHPSAHENHKVKSGHSQRGSRHGVDGSQKEEGEDVFRVVTMSSVGAKHTGFFFINILPRSEPDCSLIPCREPFADPSECFLWTSLVCEGVYVRVASAVCQKNDSLCSA